jgi:hypothetical protein
MLELLTLIKTDQSWLISLCLVDPIAYGPVVTHYIIAEVQERMLLTFWGPETKEKERGGPAFHYSLQRHTSNDLRPITGPHLTKFPPPPLVPSYGLSLSHMGLWVTVKIQAIAQSLVS